MGTEIFLIEVGTGIHLTDPPLSPTKVHNLLLSQFAGAEIKAGAQFEIEGKVFEVKSIGVYLDEFKSYIPQIQLYCEQKLY